MMARLGSERRKESQQGTLANLLPRQIAIIISTKTDYGNLAAAIDSPRRSKEVCDGGRRRGPRVRGGLS